uniref:Uncharacterized protein n=1 Tax=Mammaliicoccus lentus TaxID=42858 RepID=Q70T12_MAMLE|nr:hypothetical protein [Mammaliicoccus lentus]
MVKAVDLAS